MLHRIHSLESHNQKYGQRESCLPAGWQTIFPRIARPNSSILRVTAFVPTGTTDAVTRFFVSALKVQA